MTEESEADFLLRTRVAIENVQASVEKGGLVQLPSGETANAEQFAAQYFGDQGYDSLFRESTPLHALFAVLFWTVVQDYKDPLVRDVWFGERAYFENNGKSDRKVMTSLPQDFGTKGYGIRRADAIREILTKYPIGDRDDLHFAFDLGIEGSKVVSLTQRYAHFHFQATRVTFALSYRLLVLMFVTS